MNGIDRSVWYVLSGVLVVGLIAGIAWYVRQITLKRAALPSAFLIALAVHAALGSGLFYVGLGDEIVEAVKKVQAVIPTLDDYAASTRFEAHEGYHRPEPQPFELVRDLAAKDSVAPAVVPQAPLETPEMRVSSAAIRAEIPVPRDDAPGKRADETPVVPHTPEPVSPGRTVVSKIDAPVVPTAPLEEIASTETPRAPEPRLPGAPIEMSRKPAVVDPLAPFGSPAKGTPSGVVGSTIPADLRDARGLGGPPPAGVAKSGSTLPRATRSALDDTASPTPLRNFGGKPSEASPATGKETSVVAVEVGRAGTQAPDLSIGGPGTSVAGTGTKPGEVRPLPGIPASPLPDRRDPQPTIGTPGGALARRTGEGAIPFAGANIGPESLLKGRRVENKMEDIESRGGSKASQEAVARGLTWLERHQFPDGRFSLHGFSKACKDHKACTAEGLLPCDTAATALMLLPFLGDGHTQHDGKYPLVVEKGLDWLLAKQKRDGELTTGNEGKARLYGHGIAAIAVCEAYAMSQDPRLRDPAQRSLDFIVASQHRASGGWRYQPNEMADTSVVGWQLMALKSGQMAQLSVPQSSFDLARKWLDSVEGLGSQRGRFGYQSRIPTPSMTAEGLLCRQYLGASRDDPSLLAGAEYLLANLPHRDQENSYYWYYGTQTMYHLQGHYWKKWNAALRDMLVASQIKEGPMAGTWDPVDAGEKTGGRVFATSIRVLMLEVYYRHLPLYQSLEE